MDDFPAIKFFSNSDQSTTLPTPISCFRVDKHVAGVDYRTFFSWNKLAQYLEDFPAPP